MAFSVTIKLTTAGADTGPTFNLFSNVDSYATAFETGVSKTNLTSTNGYTSTLVPDNTTTIKVKSVNGSCPTAEVSLPISGIVTPTATPTATPTSTAGITSTPTSTLTPTVNITPTTTTTPTTTPTIDVTITPTTTPSESANCYFTQTGTGIPLSGAVVSTSGLIKVTSGTIYVWAKYNSAGTSSGTAQFGLTIGGLSATGNFTITSFGQVGYTNSGGSNSGYFTLTPGTYQYTLTKSDNYTSGNNVNVVLSTGTDPASATNLQPCLTQPSGPYLSLVNATPTTTPTILPYCYEMVFPTAVTSDGGEILQIGYQKSDGTYVWYDYNEFQDSGENSPSITINICSLVSPSIRYGDLGNSQSPESSFTVTQGETCSTSSGCGGNDPNPATPTPTLTSSGTGSSWCYTSNSVVYGPFSSLSECQNAVSNAGVMAVCNECIAGPNTE